MKVSSVFIVATAIFAGQASAQLARRTRRRNAASKQHRAGERHLQEDDVDNSFSTADSFVAGEGDGGQYDHVGGGSSKGGKQPKGEECSIEDMDGATYTPRVDVVGPDIMGMTMGMDIPDYGYLIPNLPLTLSFEEFQTIRPRRFQGTGAMSVNFCLDFLPYKLIAVQTGFTKDGIAPFTLTPILIDQLNNGGHGGGGITPCIGMNCGVVRKVDENEQEEEPKDSERRAQDYPKEYSELEEILGAKKGDEEKALNPLLLLPWTGQGEYNCKTGEIMFGGSTIALGIGLATSRPAQRRSTRWLKKRDRFDWDGCFMPNVRDEQNDADWD